MRRHFRPELLDLFDEIVVFDPLSQEQLRKVARLRVKDVASRLAKRGVALAVPDAALDFVLTKSCDPVGFTVYRRVVLYLLCGSVVNHSADPCHTITG